jgi:hypothetical protein
VAYFFGVVLTIPAGTLRFAGRVLQGSCFWQGLHDDGPLKPRRGRRGCGVFPNDQNPRKDERIYSFPSEY